MKYTRSVGPFDLLAVLVKYCVVCAHLHCALVPRNHTLVILYYNTLRRFFLFRENGKRFFFDGARF